MIRRATERTVSTGRRAATNNSYVSDGGSRPLKG